MTTFEMNKKDLLKGLSLMQSVAGRRTTLPILSHILLEWEGERLNLTGTDLETGIREELPATIHQKGRASVSAKKLYEIVKELPEQTVHVEKRENHWITLRCGKSVFNLAGLDPEEFPSLPVYEAASFSDISSAVMKEMIEKTVFAASNEESRYHLNGILFLQKPQNTETGSPGKEILRMVATDGHRLALIDRENTKIQGMEKGVVIPKKGILELKRIMSDREGEDRVFMYFDPSHGFFKIGSTLMAIRLIDGEFPEYEQVIPKENDRKMLVERQTLYACLRRVSTMASERVEGVKFSLKQNGLEVSSYHQDFGDAKEEMEISYDGASLDIGFNARYLIEALNAFETEHVQLELKDEGSPGILRPVSSDSASRQICIIMPMRI
jgi:DNA polymerase III subunit beta